MTRTAIYRTWPCVGKLLLLGVTFVVYVALLTIAPLTNCRAEMDTQTAEYRVKAAFLYKFGDYIAWPSGTFSDPGSPLTIGVVGADTLADELAQIVGDRTIGGRRVTVRKLSRADAFTNCHLLFIGNAADKHLDSILAVVKGLAVLTVTESDQAIARGSMINFVVIENKVRFDIALQAAEQGKLKISARLLSVAHKVIPGPS